MLCIGVCKVKKGMYSKGSEKLFIFISRVKLKIGRFTFIITFKKGGNHYNPRSARSTLAESISLDNRMRGKGIDERNVGPWIKNNCRISL